MEFLQFKYGRICALESQLLQILRPAALAGGTEEFVPEETITCGLRWC
jgi:hypothetical protein